MLCFQIYCLNLLIPQTFKPCVRLWEVRWVEARCPSQARASWCRGTSVRIYKGMACGLCLVLVDADIPTYLHLQHPLHAHYWPSISTPSLAASILPTTLSVFNLDLPNHLLAL